MASSSGQARRMLLVGMLVPVVLAGCGVGTGTLRIADAEAEIVAVATAIVQETGLVTVEPVRSDPLERCELRAGGEGLRTRVAVRGEVPGGPAALGDALDTAAAVLVAGELVLVESGVPGTLLSQRDGVTVTVGSDGRVLEIDALTGCRPR